MPHDALPTGLPRPDHVVVVIEENHSYERIIDGPPAPYIKSLAAQGASFTNSYGIRHPSQPNYLALFSGSTQGVKNDACPRTFAQPNLASELIAHHFTFGAYSEDLPSSGFAGCKSGDYRRKHSPWVNFTNVPPSTSMPWTQFPKDFSKLPTLSFVIPDMTHDMHDRPAEDGDIWLSSHLDGYVHWAKKHNSLFILTWDEDDDRHQNHIPTIFVGAGVRPGLYPEKINHYNVLRTLEDMYGLPELGDTATAAPITDVWLNSTNPIP